MKRLAFVALPVLIVAVVLPGCTRPNPGFGLADGDGGEDEGGDGDGDSGDGDGDGDGDGSGDGDGDADSDSDSGVADTGMDDGPDPGPDFPPDEPYCEVFWLEASADTFYQQAPSEGSSCQVMWDWWEQAFCQHLNFGSAPWHWVGGGYDGYYSVKWNRQQLDGDFVIVEYAKLHVQVYNPENLPGTLQVRPFMHGAQYQWFEGDQWGKVPPEQPQASTYKYRDFPAGVKWNQESPLFSTEEPVGVIELEDVYGLQTVEVELDDVRMNQWLADNDSNGFLIGGTAQIFDTQITGREGPGDDPNNGEAPMLEIEVCTAGG